MWLLIKNLCWVSPGSSFTGDVSLSESLIRLDYIELYGFKFWKLHCCSSQKQYKTNKQKKRNKWYSSCSLHLSMDKLCSNYSLQLTVVKLFSCMHNKIKPNLYVPVMYPWQQKLQADVQSKMCRGRDKPGFISIVWIVCHWVLIKSPEYSLSEREE